MKRVKGKLDKGQWIAKNTKDDTVMSMSDQ